MAGSVRASMIAPPLRSEQACALDTNPMCPSRSVAARRARQVSRAVVSVMPWTGTLQVMLEDCVMPGGDRSDGNV